MKGDRGEESRGPRDTTQRLFFIINIGSPFPSTEKPECHLHRDKTHTLLGDSSLSVSARLNTKCDFSCHTEIFQPLRTAYYFLNTVIEKVFIYQPKHGKIFIYILLL